MVGRPPGLPVFTDVEWAELDDYVPAVPMVAAIESWFGEGLAVATAEVVDGHIGVSVDLVASVADAAALVMSMLPRPNLVLAGKSVAADPVLVALGALPVRMQGRAAVTELRRYVDDDVIRHDGSPDLADQVLAVRTVPGVDGPRVRSTDRMDAVKAVVFAVEEVHRHAGAPQVW